LILMTVDHRIPKSKGGSDDLSNLQTMCHSCNHKKGSKIEDTSTYRGLARK
jgi:5-methylcytosine-specific restriction endonuclease McrA